MLATHRFEVLQQVQCVPEVLGNVIAEVERRQLYRTWFLEVCFTQQVIIPQLINMFCSAQHAKTASRQFKTARDEERNQRRAFREKFDHHFILTLFPSLSDRPPEFAVSIINVDGNVTHNTYTLLQISIPEKFDEDLALLAEDDLAALKRHLPSDLHVQ